MRQEHDRKDAAAPPITSSLLDDPEMLELVEYFVEELDGHVHVIAEALDSVDLDTLKRVSHQLKGAAGGYGFPTIGQAAAEVEQVALADEADLNELRERVENLIDLCRRASAGTN